MTKPPMLAEHGVTSNLLHSRHFGDSVLRWSLNLTRMRPVPKPQADGLERSGINVLALQPMSKLVPAAISSTAWSDHGDLRAQFDLADDQLELQ